MALFFDVRHCAFWVASVRIIAASKDVAWYDRSVRTVLLMLVLSGVLGATVDVAAQGNGTDEALVLFHRARDAYQAGEFERSALFLEEALRLQDAPPLHYNLARAFHALGRWEQARAEYLRFLEMEPDSPRRGRIEAHLRVVNEAIQQSADDEEDRAGETPAGETPSERARPQEDGAEVHGESQAEGAASPAPWIVLGAGAATLGAASVFAGLARRAQNEAEGAPDHRSAIGPDGDARQRARVANVLFIAGGVVAVAGLVWGLTTFRRGQVQVDVGAGTVTLRGRF